MAISGSSHTPVLVTGGLGFLGRHVVRGLLAAGEAVRIGDLPSPSEANLGDLKGKVSYAHLDITQPASCREALTGCKGVVHLAALVKDVAPWRDFRRVTIEGTRNVLNAASMTGAGRFVQISSVAVHAFAGREEADETAPRDATLWYGLAKAKAEEAVEAAHAVGKVRASIVRPGLVPYGPGDKLALPALVEALRKRQVTLVNGGSGRICTAFAPDFGRAVATVFQAPKAVGKTLILADERAVTWKEYFEGVAQVFGVPAPGLNLPRKFAQTAGAAVEDFWRFTKPGELPPLSRYRTQLVSGSHHFSGAKARRLLGIRMDTEFLAGLQLTKESMNA